MDDVIARIKHKLVYLQEHDDGDVTDATYERKWQIQEHYPYEVHTQHTEDEIAEFEARHQIRLPEDYRQFLMQIGSRGFNPGYIMYSPLDDLLTHEELDDFLARSNNPDEEIDEDELWKEDAMVIGNLARSFSFENTMTYQALEQHRVRHNLSWDDHAWQIDGYLTISADGCQCYYILIMSGNARGQIWYQDGLGMFAPVFYIDGDLYHHNYTLKEDVRILPDAQRVTFTQWYEAWLNKQIRIAQEHWQKRGRDVPPLTLPAE